MTLPVSPKAERPECLDRPPIRRMFQRFLVQLDRQPVCERSNRLTEKLTKKHFRDLHNPSEPGDDDVLWRLLQTCEQEGLITLEPFKKNPDPDLPPWFNYRVVFNIHCEETLRVWLSHPRISPGQVCWQQAVDQYRGAFARPEQLDRILFAVLDKPPHEIIKRLAMAPEILAEKPMTAYQLSARIFWGYSKVLKEKEAWIKALFDLPDGALLERPVLVEAAFPEGEPGGILMLENLDSYLSAGDGRWDGCDRLIRVYTQGFKAASPRIRSKEHVRFHLSDTHRVPPEQNRQFQAAWFGKQPFPYPVYFIGDLDWSGLSIFRSLKSVFPELLPWKRGYEIMIRAREDGRCHAPEMAAKSGQKRIETSGDAWLDKNVVMPMKERPAFVDQEVIG